MAWRVCGAAGGWAWRHRPTDGAHPEQPTLSSSPCAAHPAPRRLRRFSIINSLMIVLFLSGMVAMIMMRTLHRDFNRYNATEAAEDV